jgi:ATP-dependent Lon protease
MDKNIVIKKNNSNDVNLLVDKKIDFFKDIVQKTVLHVYKNKFLDILGINDVNACIEKLNQLSKKINDLSVNKTNSQEVLINELQFINNELSSLFKNYGTQNLEDLILICFGNNNNKISTNQNEDDKLELLKKYFHPTGYKVISVGKKTDKKPYDENSNNIGCSDISISYKQLHMKVFGIKVCINNNKLNKNIIVFGILDDIIVDFLNNNYILSIKKTITQNLPEEIEANSEAYAFFISSLTLKDYLICESPSDYYTKFMGYLNQNNIIHQKQIAVAVKEFITDDTYNKRNTLIQLLIKSSSVENQYLAYLLYDLLSNDTNGNIDSQEQIIIFDSFPWPVKQHFKQAMKKTVQYTNDLSNFDINKIPIEQQICLLKATDNVKEKAMMKLKEVKSKSEDSGSKARQYLDGLLKIPFGIYKKEPILYIMDDNRNKFKNIYNLFDLETTFPYIPNKEKYTSVEVLKYIKQINGENDESNKVELLKEQIVTFDRKELVKNICYINNILKKHNKKEITKYISLTKNGLKEEINKFITSCNNPENMSMLCELTNNMSMKTGGDTKIKNKSSIYDEISLLNNSLKRINEYMIDVKVTLDKAVHGHDKAKKQIERIIGQWINGELDGYCFGFEGPPGVGKTSLAKRGISNCLKDNNGSSRPFSMIQMGGDSNGSTLHGHNYTYVGSTWGSIVQILIDKKCMNPIIFIDEVDKISKTEHGKEIVGILTHLLDPAQNDCFQDKYFTGIDLDLSKALFILSYNDVDAIDKILLDRVHRIKFNNLTLDDKLIISKTHILPEVYKKMGLENMINFSEEVLKFIIDEYTSESGVRKLKEILFEIVGEINLDILKNYDNDFNLPIIITEEDIKKKYFKDKHEIKHKKIHTENKIGIINGLWANALGKGGVIPIQVNWLPSDKFLSLKLTGMQGDVMKESMNVALTLAWKLTPISIQKQLRCDYSDVTNLNGVHIHCPEGAVPKDGPSAGTAITTAIFSIFNNKKINYSIAITGEISLDGNVTEIGGLDLKFVGGIKAGVKQFIFPNENLKDYNTFIEKYKGNEILNGIRFCPVDTIDDVFKLVFENDE